MSSSGLKAAGSGTPQLTVRAVILAVVLAMVLFTVQACRKALQSDRPTAQEIPYAPLPANADEIIRGAAH